MPKKFICTSCAHEWQLSQNTDDDGSRCPACRKSTVHRVDAGARHQAVPTQVPGDSYREARHV